MKYSILFLLMFGCMIISCQQRVRTVTTTDPTTGQTTTTTEDIIPATVQPPFTGVVDYYGNSDYGYGGFWDTYGRYRFFTGLNYQYGYGEHFFYYHPIPSINIYQPSIRTYGYSSSSSITYGGKTINRGSGVGSIIPQRSTTINNNSGNISRGNGTSTMRANGSVSIGNSSRTYPSTNSYRASSPSSSFRSSSSTMRSSGGISRGGRR